MILEILKYKGQNCSNQGISSKYDEVIVVDDFDDNAEPNAVVIVEDKVFGKVRKRAIPANNSQGYHPMFGGCFVYTCNSIFKHSGEAIKLHDRFEP